MTDRGPNKAKQKTFTIMRKFAEKYAQRTDTYFCSDPKVTTAVLEGLAVHKDELGTPLCPCRFYEDKGSEVKRGYWNCPCAPMRERKECHCMLFLPAEHAYAGDSRVLNEAELSYDD